MAVSSRRWPHARATLETPPRPSSRPCACTGAARPPRASAARHDAARPNTLALWAQQDGRHPGDRLRLFRAIADAIAVERVLYPGSFVDITPSFVFPSVTYVDVDRRAASFFADEEGVQEIVMAHRGTSQPADVRFIGGDYSSDSSDLGLDDEDFDLLVSLYAGFVSESCTRYLRSGGHLLVNPSHGDAALASIDPRYRLEAVIDSRDGDYRVEAEALDTHLVTKRGEVVTRELLHRTGRGVAYTRSPFAYLFVRVR